MNQSTLALALVTLGLVSACGGGGGGGDGGGGDENPVADVPVTTTDYAFLLSADEVIDGAPAHASSASAALQTRARGTFEIVASGTVTLNGIDATRVDIHAGFAGETGPMILALQQQSATTWAIPANTEIDDAELRVLESAGFYVRVSGPQGVIRGQVLPAGWGVFMFDLSGEDVVPEISSAASGRGGLTLNITPPDGRYTYHLRVTADNLADPTGGSLADAYAGANGDERLALTRSLTAPAVWGSGEINDPNFEPFFSTTTLGQLAAGRLHVVIRSSANPDGEIRGQIVPPGVQVFRAALTADQVVGGGPAVAPGSATAVVTYRDFNGDLTINLRTDVPNAVTVSLHEAPAGQDGPLLFSLLQDFSVPGSWSLPITTLTAEQQAALAADELYIAMTTVDYPGGALRGQLVEPSATASKSLRFEAVVDEATRQTTNLDASGGTLTLITSDNATIGMTVPKLAVAESVPFSMAEITSVAGLPQGARVLAAAQLGPAGSVFATPVRLTFDVSGMRTPGTALVGFVTTDDGRDFALLPVSDADGIDGLAATARTGERVSLPMLHFSNGGIIELGIEALERFSVLDILRGPDGALVDQFLLEFFNRVLDTSLTIPEINALTDAQWTTMVRERRADLHGAIDDFISRDVMDPVFLTEFIELYLQLTFTNLYDLDFEWTTRAEWEASEARIVELAGVYAAGLHLRCFVDPEGIDEALGGVAPLLTLRAASQLTDGAVDDALLDEAARIADELSTCFNQHVLDVYFESFNDVVGDEFVGTATNLQTLSTDNIRDEQTVTTSADRSARLFFTGPTLVSLDPLTIRFANVLDDVTTTYTDTAQLIFGPPGEEMRSAQLSLAQETTSTFASSPAAQADGERPIITANVSTVASGPVTVTPNEIAITYSFDSLETNDGLVENISRNLTGDVTVSKRFTPRSFADEFELWE